MSVETWAQGWQKLGRNLIQTCQDVVLRGFAPLNSRNDTTAGTPAVTTELTPVHGLTRFRPPVALAAPPAWRPLPPPFPSLPPSSLRPPARPLARSNPSLPPWCAFTTSSSNLQQIPPLHQRLERRCVDLPAETHDDDPPYSPRPCTSLSLSLYRAFLKFTKTLLNGCVTSIPPLSLGEWLVRTGGQRQGRTSRRGEVS